VAGAVVAGFLDAVGIMPSSFDDARVGAVPAAGIEILRRRDVGHDPGQDGACPVRGEKPGRRPGG
jgi:hypothetical protein